MNSTPPRRIRTIRDYHQLVGLPAPPQPLLSVMKFEDVRWEVGRTSPTLVCDFYSIALKRNATARMKYGQQAYDFEAGLLTFLAPGQVFQLAEERDEALPPPTGLLLLVQPDFLWNTPLAATIKEYDYFGYADSNPLPKLFNAGRAS